MTKYREIIVVKNPVAFMMRDELILMQTPFLNLEMGVATPFIIAEGDVAEFLQSATELKIDVLSNRPYLAASTTQQLHDLQVVTIASTVAGIASTLIAAFTLSWWIGIVVIVLSIATGATWYFRGWNRPVSFD